ncbi:MAG: M14 family zinc carboxypeptidase [Bacteroidales bacterium]
MKRYLIIPVLWVVLFTSLNGNSFAQSSGEHYIRFVFDEKKELEQITRLVSIDKVVRDTVYAYASDDQLEHFSGFTNYEFEFTQPYGIMANNIEMAEEVSQMSDWDKYPTYDVYLQMMEEFEVNYPDICTIDYIGQTVEGRELVVAKIGNNPDEHENKPQVFYTSTMHGDETTGYVLMLRLIDSILSTYDTSPKITHLIDNVDIYINPIANPDGTYSGGDNTVSEAIRANSNYKDLNRDFPDPVDGENESYEPETEAMMNFAENNNIILSANFHGGAEVVNYPWDGVSRAHNDEGWFIDIAQTYASGAKENSPDGYFESVDASGIINGYDWYPIYGGRQDYMTYFQHSREVTLEISDTKLLSSDLLPEYWDYNKEALFQYLEQVLYGIKGKVVNEQGDNLNAKTEVLNHDTEEDRSYVFSNSQTGFYYRMIEPGTYNIAFHADGYKSDTVSGVIVPEEDFIRVDAVLERGPLLSTDKDSIQEALFIDSSSHVDLILNWYGDQAFEYQTNAVMNNNESWISIEPDQGLITDDSDTLNIQLNAEGLSSDVYNADLEIFNQDSVWKIIPVELKVKENEETGINKDSFRGIRCYPNPFQYTIELDIDVRDPVTPFIVEAYNYSGQLIRSFSFGNLRSGRQTLSIQFKENELKNFSIVYLRIYLGEETITRKMLHINSF